MPLTSIYFPSDWTNEDVTEFMDQVTDVALTLGFTTHGGPKAGRGNVARMLAGLVAGELVIKRNMDFDGPPPFLPPHRRRELDEGKAEGD